MTPSWYEVPCGLELLSEFNTIAPDRDHASDGTIGDAAHQAEHSDHNPDREGAVRALDVDNTFNQSGLSMEMIVQYLLARCRAGYEQRITYIIYNRRIWEQDNGWRERTYTGSSPHTEHAHFSFSHNDRLANSRAPFYLEDIPVSLTQSDREWIANTIAAAFTDRDTTGLVETTVGHDVLSQQVPDYTQSGTPQAAFYVAFDNLVKVVMNLKASIAVIENDVEGLAHPHG